MAEDPDFLATADVTPERHRRALDSVTAYRIASSLADEGWEDASSLSTHPTLADVARQLLRAIGSIVANVASGYAYRAPRDRVRYYEYALASVEDAESLYHIATRAIPAATRAEREKKLTSIRRLLVKMISNERAGANWNSPRR